MASEISGPRRVMVERVIQYLVKRNRWLRACHSNATAISWRNRTEALRVDFRKRTRVWRREPEAQEVSLALGLRVILECSAIVQDGVVVHELNVAPFEFHHQVQPWIVCQFIQKIERLDLQRAEWRHLMKAPRRLDVLSLIDRRNQSVVIVEDGNVEIRFAAFGNFTTPVGFDWLH